MVAAIDRVADRNRQLLEEALAVVGEARERGIAARLLGGLGVLHHDDELRERGGSRPINDIDLIVPAGQHRATAQLLMERGYQPEARFNALNGHRRMLFHGETSDLDVLVGTFEMCHRIEMADRLSLDYPTLSVADLLLTKLQVIKLNAKDAGDIVDLVRGHDLGTGHGDWIEVERLTTLVRDDWGLWRTITGTIATVVQTHDDAIVNGRLTQLADSLNAVPKTRRWRLRARVGDRVAWYVLPDEVNQ